MIRKFKIRDIFNCKFVFRHRYEYINDKDKYRIEKLTTWKEWTIGLWFRPYKAVGIKNFGKPSEW